MDIHDAESLVDLYEKADEQDRRTLGLQALSMLAILGAADSWDDLRELVEQVVSTAEKKLRLPISDLAEPGDRQRWEELVDL